MFKRLCQALKSIVNALKKPVSKRTSAVTSGNVKGCLRLPSNASVLLHTKTSQPDVQSRLHQQPKIPIIACNIPPGLSIELKGGKLLVSQTSLRVFQMGCGSPCAADLDPIRTAA